MKWNWNLLHFQSDEIMCSREYHEILVQNWIRIRLENRREEYKFEQYHGSVDDVKWFRNFVRNGKRMCEAEQERETKSKHFTVNDFCCFNFFFISWCDELSSRYQKVHLVYSRTTKQRQSEKNAISDQQKTKTKILNLKMKRIVFDEIETFAWCTYFLSFLNFILCSQFVSFISFCCFELVFVPFAVARFS